MVTAGVYMIARMNFVYSLAPWALTVIALVGGATALFAGTIGVAQNDIKKVLAYSTVSQLGFMFMGVGVGAYFAGIFHLVTHAFFKALLFLGSGAVIHALHGEQDIRKMGGLKKFMPITFWTFAIASVAIAGLPPFAGFFSKDEILWKSFSTTHLATPNIGKLVWLMGAVAAAFTAFYMTRLVILTFFGELRSAPAAAHGQGHGDPHGGAGHDEAPGHGTPHESPASMWIPLVVLAALSVGAGFIGMPHWMGGGQFERWLEPVCPEPGAAAEAADPGQGPEPGGGAPHSGPAPMELALMLFSVAVAAGAIAWAWKIYAKEKGAPAERFAREHRGLYELVRDKYRVDELYERAVVAPLLAANETLAQFDAVVVDGAVNGVGEIGVAASTSSGVFDNEVVDGGVNATGRGAQAAGRSVRRLQSGNIRAYIAATVVGSLFVIAFFCLYEMNRNGVLPGLLGH
jgi:NADH-quinone oxidoreductase subunit L